MVESKTWKEQPLRSMGRSCPFVILAREQTSPVTVDERVFMSTGLYATGHMQRNEYFPHAVQISLDVESRLGAGAMPRL